MTWRQPKELGIATLVYECESCLLQFYQFNKERGLLCVYPLGKERPDRIKALRDDPLLIAHTSSVHGHIDYFCEYSNNREETALFLTRLFTVIPKLDPLQLNTLESLMFFKNDV